MTFTSSDLDAVPTLAEEATRLFLVSVETVRPTRSWLIEPSVAVALTETAVFSAAFNLTSTLPTVEERETGTRGPAAAR
jgi:hypothetical protein